MSAKTIQEFGMNHYSKWLIIRNGAIGDTILLSSTLQTIRLKIPDAWIEIMGNLERISLLVGPEMANQTVSIEQEGTESLYVLDGEIHPKIKQYLDAFDIVIFYVGQNHQIIQSRLKLLLHCKIIVYPALPHEQFEGHAIQHYLNAIQSVINIERLEFPKLHVLESEKLFAKKLLIEDFKIDINNRFLMGLHAGAGNQAKRMDIDYFFQIVFYFQKRIPLSIFLINGPADKDTITHFLSMLPDKQDFIHMDVYPLNVLKAIINQFDLFIGNDSGISHLAAAVGCPTVVFFKASNPKIWAPLGSHVRIFDFQECSIK